MPLCIATKVLKKHTKRNILLFAFFLLASFLVLGVFSDMALAQQQAVQQVEITNTGGFFGTIKEGFFYVLNGILYAVYQFVSLPVSLAATLLGYAIDPTAVNNLFTLPAIETLWKMVRDFFNLFFILTLLFIAFATIFQISSFNYKSALGKLLLMALLVNFSYPISRFIIDTANVPMYFFVESMFSTKSQASGGNIAEVAFSASKIKNLILPGRIEGNSDYTQKIITAIVFMFLFGVSLLVLSVLLIIRSIVLVILIIFSSVGFAGLAIPGFRQYATKWWNNLLKYAFFGPAAMLMLLVSVGFMKEFSPNGSINPDLMKFAQSTGGDATYLASMASMLIPVILIWMSITVGQAMGIAGASAVTSRAQQFSKWAGRKGARGLGYVGVGIPSAAVSAVTLGRVPMLTPTRLKAIGSGAQEGWKNFSKTGKAFGKAVPGMKKFGLTQDAQEEANARAAGFFKYGKGGISGAERALQEKRIAAAKKEYKDSGASRSTVAADLSEKNDPITRMAAAQTMAENKWIQTADQLKAVLASVGNFNIDRRDDVDAKKANEQYQKDELSRIIANVDENVIKSMSPEALSGIFNASANEKFFKKAVIARDANGNPIDGHIAYEYDPSKPKEKTDLHKALEGRFGKANKLDVLVKFEAREFLNSGQAADENDALEKAYKSILNGKSKKDIVSSAGLFSDGADGQWQHFKKYLDTKDDDYIRKMLSMDEISTSADTILRGYYDNRPRRSPSRGQQNVP